MSNPILTNAALACALLTASLASAEPTLELRVSGPTEIFAGDPQSASLDANGVIGMGPVLTELAALAEYPVVTMLAAGDHVYVGTGGGGVVRVDAAGKTEQVLAADKLVVTALVRRNGDVYAATSPEGKIRRLRAGRPAESYADPATKYVWAMLDDPRGLIVATGEPGRVLSIGRDGRSRTLFDPDEAHVRALLRHPTRGVIAGGGSKGIVYQLTEDGGAFALYDSSMEEVTALAVDPATGDLYAAMVSEAKAGSFVPARSIGAVADDPPEDTSPVRGSEVVRIAANGRVDLLWNSRREGALALHFDAASKALYVSTGTGKKGRGRIYVIETKDRDRLSLFARVTPSIASAMVPAPTGGALIIGTAPTGTVVRLGPGLGSEAVYLTAEQALHRISRLGRLWFDADMPKGSRVEVSVRTGNTALQDATWSKWSAPVGLADGGPIEVPQGTYAQLRAKLIAAGNGAAPRVKSLHASVVRMNVAPQVTEVFLLQRGVYLRPMPKEAEKEKTLTISDSAIDKLRGAAPPREDVRVRQGSEPGWMTATWRAGDANGDALLFRLELRPVSGDEPWRVLADGLETSFYSLDSRAHPDAKYVLRVTASDRPSNPPDAALADSLESEPFTIDNAPPTVDALTASSAGAGAIAVRATARDAASQLGDAHVSINGGPWLALPSTDGLIDAKTERFAVQIEADGTPGAPKIEKGRNTVLVRVQDTAGNTATRSTSVDVR